jgi:lipopolysaccharide/colanic/teichoic acid biosynthesis glycosyltransferase
MTKSEVIDPTDPATTMLNNLNGTKKNGNNGHSIEHAAGALLPEEHFRRMLCRERKRSERSKKHLLLMLVDGKGMVEQKNYPRVLQHLSDLLCAGVRETDLVGWFETGSVLGVVFTELGQTDIKLAINVIQAKVAAAIQNSAHAADFSKLLVSFYAFPEGWGANGNGNGNGHGRSLDPALYPDLFEAEKAKRLSLLLKRAMDIVGASVALMLSSPLFLSLAAVIKVTSKGPVFFRQKRVGQYGIPFQFLKFRSMYVSNDADIHKDYIKGFIAGNVAASNGNGKAAPVYKITNDPRVTWIGKVMRRSSLDEIPQFWNVLKGEMSLVGPRPPIPYEIESYDLWHRRRVLESKPGITGLWQVHGRSRTTFDEMVRLDLRYSKNWSPLLDAKILLKTPRAVVSGDGAY